jgi:hypothetical protein
MKLRNENAFIQIVQWVKTKLAGKEVTSEELVQNIEKMNIDYTTTEVPESTDFVDASEQILKRTGVK